MEQLLQNGTAFILVAIVAVVALLVVAYLLVSRRRTMKSSVDEAVMEALQRITRAAADLRRGLSGESADVATPQLRELLKCVAVGVADSQGTLLSWDGEANYHYADVEGPINRAIHGHRREHVDHDRLECPHRGSCPMRSAVIVPLVVEQENAGALVVVGGVTSSKRLIRMADEIAHFICTQLELARLEESREQLAYAEIKALRAQISPHFMYNALNTIASLIRRDPEQARELLEDFAEFTRYSFRMSSMYTTLADELRNIDRYLTLERARYGPRLGTRINIAPEVFGVAVPFLVLQPLVENAVRHGLAKKPGGGTVTVLAQDHGNDVLITVEDDGVGMDPDRLTADLADAHKTGAHVGIGNINQRMRSAYGDEYALELETAPGEGMKIMLRVPKTSRTMRPAFPDYSEQASGAYHKQ
ncbi:histidine kinase [Sciscionella marina]|uniref:GAF domain-containing sensor histidine kinase n=1 Tax=Sciscionella TaxID=596495 RepID=UPI00035D02DC